jgi:two-component system sensor histidine kinase KdpD
LPGDVGRAKLVSRMDRLQGLTGVRAPSRWGRVLVTLVAPSAATGVALALPGRNTASAASLYLLGVVAASAVGGLLSGLAAAVLSFLGLNYFFTDPLHTFVVRELEDLVALPVFLAVAAVVGAVVARALAERDRAERRTREARALNAFTTRLLAGEPVRRVLEVALADLLRVFELSRAEISATVGGEPVSVALSRPGLARGDQAPPIEIPMGAKGAPPLGSVTAVPRATQPGLGESDRTLLEAFTGQIALALQRAQHDAEIRDARIEAEASGLRAALFSSITHDLRTPLASIKASVGSLLDPEAVHDEREREELLRTSLEEADRLNRLVANLLDLARIRAGGLTPSLSLVALDEVVESVLARMRPMLAPFRVRTFIRPDAPPTWVDPVQLDQALTNVLENSTRFSPPGTELRVAVHPWQSWIEVRVADRGPGIPEAERDEVFEPFHRRDRGEGRGGSGLGLAIARAIVVAHEGRIWIEATPGGGTTVVLQFPVLARRGGEGAVPSQETSDQ